MPAQSLRLWDPVVRLFHLSIAGVFITNYFFNEAGGDWHVWLGYYAGAWLLVRAYRLSRELKEANGELPAQRAARNRAANSARPRQNKRYTPPSSPPKRQPPKPGDEKKAG